MSVIRNREYAQRIKDFSGLRFGKISPTDIDAFLEFGNRLFVFIETKFGDSPIPYGQGLALERLCDACHTEVRGSLLLIASYDSSGDIDVSMAIVRKYRYEGKWHEAPDMTVREVIEIFINKYGL